jgi:trans-L-3-hydroxyproline dehydratase
MTFLDPLNKWQNPDDLRTVRTLDAHTAGEPLRIIIGGYPDLHGDTILEKRRYATEHLDHWRRILMAEPRGHNDMYGAIVTPPTTPDAQLGVLFMHNEGYSPMCGHGIIALATVAVDTGLAYVTEPETVIGIDTPAGLVTAHVKVDRGKAQSVYFENVPSFVQQLDLAVDVPGFGSIKYDLAFGGAFYAYVDVAQVDLTCLKADYVQLIDVGMRIKAAVMAAQPMEHPFEDDLNFLYGVIFVGPPADAANHSSNVCIFADGQIDRSPTGTGVSGRVAIHHARGELAVGKPTVIESIIGSTFTTTIDKTTTFGKYDAVVPIVEGTAFITGRHEFLVDDRDPLKDGFSFNRTLPKLDL